MMVEYACQHCGFKTREKRDLAAHLPIHSGEKSFRCTHCEYRASSKSQLVAHVRVHTAGDDVYQCAHCVFRCASKRALTEHLQRAHAAVNKPFRCTMCEFRSNNNSYLIEHMRIHVGERPSLDNSPQDITCASGSVGPSREASTRHKDDGNDDDNDHDDDDDDDDDDGDDDGDDDDDNDDDDGEEKDDVDDDTAHRDRWRGQQASAAAAAAAAPQHDGGRVLPVGVVPAGYLRHPYGYMAPPSALGQGYLTAAATHGQPIMMFVGPPHGAGSGMMASHGAGHVGGGMIRGDYPVAFVPGDFNIAAVTPVDMRWIAAPSPGWQARPPHFQPGYPSVVYAPSPSPDVGLVPTQSATPDPHSVSPDVVWGSGQQQPSSGDHTKPKGVRMHSSLPWGTLHLPPRHPVGSSGATTPSTSVAHGLSYRVEQQQQQRAHHEEARSGRVSAPATSSDETEDKPFACTVCDYRTTQKAHLKTHLLIHSGEKPFQCHLCEYRCTTKSDLSKHVRVHTGEKPFQCGTCDFRACTKSDLTRHMLVHTGEKPFQCKFCEFRANQKSNLTRHLRSHTGEKPFHCPTCNFGANQKSDLTRHLRVHTGEKPYECEHCGYRTGDKSALNRHLRGVHKLSTS